MSERINYLIEKFKEPKHVALLFILLTSLFAILGGVTSLPYVRLLGSLLVLSFFSICFFIISYQHPEIMILLFIIYCSSLELLHETYDKLIEFISPSSFQIFPMDLIILVLIAVAVLKSGIFLKKYALKKHNLEHLSILYCLFGLLTILGGAFRGDTNLFFYYRLYAFSLLAISLPVIVNTPKKLYNLVMSMIIVNGIVGICILIKEVILGKIYFGYLSINAQFNLFSMSILLSLLFYERKDLLYKIAVYLFLPVGVILLIVDQSRKQYLGLVIILIAIILVNFRKLFSKKCTAVISIITVLVLLLALASGSTIMSYFSRVYSRGTQLRWQEESGLLWRVHAMKFGITEVIKQYPILGFGTGENRELTTRMLKSRPVGAATHINPHNMYVTIMILGGMLGLSFFIYFQISIFKRAWTLCKIERGLLKAISIGLFLGLFSYLVNMFFEGFTIFTMSETWFYAGLILSAYNIHTRKLRL